MTFKSETQYKNARMMIKALADFTDMLATHIINEAVKNDANLHSIAIGTIVNEADARIPYLKGADIFSVIRNASARDLEMFNLLTYETVFSQKSQDLVKERGFERPRGALFVMPLWLYMCLPADIEEFNIYAPFNEWRRVTRKEAISLQEYKEYYLPYVLQRPYLN